METLKKYRLYSIYLIVIASIVSILLLIGIFVMGSYGMLLFEIIPIVFIIIGTIACVIFTKEINNK